MRLKRRYMPKQYVISDGVEELYTTHPANQTSDDNFRAFTSLNKARIAKEAWDEELGYTSGNDSPSPLGIYELKKVE